MTIKLKLYHIAIIIAVLTASYFIVRAKYSNELDSAQISLYEAQKAIYDDSINYSVKINGLMHYVSEQKALVVSSDRSLKKSEGERDRLKALRIKDVVSISDLNAKVSLLEAELELSDATIITIVDTLSQIPYDYMRIPISASYNDKWTSIDVSVGRESKFDLTLDIPITGTIGYKKTSMFKKEVYSILDTPVPYVSISKNNVIVVQEKRKWWERNGTAFGAGFVSAFAVWLAL